MRTSVLNFSHENQNCFHAKNACTIQGLILYSKTNQTDWPRRAFQNAAPQITPHKLNENTAQVICFFAHVC